MNGFLFEGGKLEWELLRGSRSLVVVIYPSFIMKTVCAQSYDVTKYVRDGLDIEHV